MDEKGRKPGIAEPRWAIYKWQQMGLSSTQHQTAHTHRSTAPGSLQTPVSLSGRSLLADAAGPACRIGRCTRAAPHRAGRDTHKSIKEGKSPGPPLLGLRSQGVPRLAAICQLDRMAGPTDNAAIPPCRMLSPDSIAGASSNLSLSSWHTVGQSAQTLTPSSPNVTQIRRLLWVYVPQTANGSVGPEHTGDAWHDASEVVSVTKTKYSVRRATPEMSAAKQAIKLGRRKKQAVRRTPRTTQSGRIPELREVILRSSSPAGRDPIPLAKVASPLADQEWSQWGR